MLKWPFPLWLSAEFGGAMQFSSMGSDPILTGYKLFHIKVLYFQNRHKSLIECIDLH